MNLCRGMARGSYRCAWLGHPVKICPADLEAFSREAALGPGGRRVPMRRVAVLGTGIMGAGMARCSTPSLPVPCGSANGRAMAPG